MKITKETKGFVKGLSDTDYHNDRNFVSSSVIKTALNKPQEYYKIYSQGAEPKPINESARLVGTYVHCALLEPELLHEKFVVWPGTRRGKEYTAFYDKSKAEGKEVLGKTHYDTCQELLTSFNTTKVQTSIKDFVMADTLFQDGHTEESLFTTLKDVPVKVRFDYRSDKKDNGKYVIRDLKTSSALCNDVETTKEVIDKYGYDLSAAMYVDALAEELNIPTSFIDYEWVFISKADFATNIYKASEETLNKGREKYVKGLKKIKQWTDNGYDDIFKVREI